MSNPLRQIHMSTSANFEFLSQNPNSGTTKFYKSVSIRHFQFKFKKICIFIHLLDI